MKSASGIIGLLQRLWLHLSRRRRRQFVALLGLVLFSTFAEVISLGAVLPFLAALATPESVLGDPNFVPLLRSWGVMTTEHLVRALTILFVTAAVLAGAIRMLLLWASTRLAFASGADLGIEVYRRTLYQPYSVHTARNSSDVISGITKKVDGVVFYVLVPVLTLLSSTVQLVAITIVLIFIDPTVALMAIASFGSNYALIAWISRRRLRYHSHHIAREQTQVIKVLQEGLGGIRDVLLDGSQSAYVEVYRRADRPLRSAQAYVVINSASPRFAMEALGMVLIAALAYGLSRQSGGLATALPLLGALALAAQRVLPALQQAYAAWANIVASHASLADTVALLEQPLPEELTEPVTKPLVFRESIEFVDVRFRYSGDAPWVLGGLNLRIRKGARIGFVGSTGSGKSTTLDLLMGLLTPTAGQLLVDGQIVMGARLRAWQRALAHVPQHVFLADATVAENIAFGVPHATIDIERVREAARRAQIADYIESQPEGYDAFVGERGVRLSGGQRQRIGIARALYKQASVLVLDEATSALDNATERSVMTAIQDLARDVTVLLIAHRLTTVQHCDTVVELRNGCVAAQGTYQELLECSSTFRQMAQAQGS